MPRKKFIAQTQFPYHISNRCNNKEWFDVPLSRVWHLFNEQILDSADRFSVWPHSFVLMSNHFHMMVTTPMANLDNFLRHFLTETARALKLESQRTNHIFGGRTKQTILDNAYSVSYVYKYIYRNPVRVNLANKVEDYEFSTLHQLVKGVCQLSIVQGLDRLWEVVPKERDKLLNWLNQPTPKELELLISKGLRRSHFKFSKSNAVRKQLEELVYLYQIPVIRDPYLLGPMGE